jgi:hypothetical protein
MIAGERVGHNSRQLFPGIIELGTWRQSLIDAMCGGVKGSTVARRFRSPRWRSSCSAVRSSRQTRLSLMQDEHRPGAFADDEVALPMRRGLQWSSTRICPRPGRTSAIGAQIEICCELCLIKAGRYTVTGRNCRRFRRFLAAPFLFSMSASASPWALVEARRRSPHSPGPRVDI